MDALNAILINFSLFKTRLLGLSRAKKKSERITPVLYELHWLGVRERIIFKVLLIVYKILLNLAPFYLCNLIDRHIPGRNGLRSSNTDLLLLQRRDSKSTTKIYGMRAFSIHAPLLWNDLPVTIHQSKRLDCFKRNLKTHLFKTLFESLHFRY